MLHWTRQKVKNRGYCSDLYAIICEIKSHTIGQIFLSDGLALLPFNDAFSFLTVDMICFVHDLVGTDTIGVIHELQERLPAVAAHLPELANRHFPRPPAEQNALRVLDVLT